MSTLRLEVLEGGAIKGSTLLTGISVIGRGDACSIVIDDQYVSSEHAMIREEPGQGFVLEDLDSRAGTYHNGVRTRKAVLLDGDTIKIGPILFRVRTDAAAAAGEVPLEDVELVQTKHLPTQRLSLDAVRFRTSRRYLKDTGRLRNLLNESGEDAGGTKATPDAPTVDVDPYAPLPEDDEGASEVERRLEILLEITNSLAAIHEPSRLAHVTGARLLQLFPQARRVGFFRFDESDGENVLRPSLLLDRTQPKGAKGGTVQISRSVLQTAVGERQAILSHDIHVDERFKRSESLEEAGVTSMLCVPLCVGEKSLGAIYVDSTDPQRRFDEGSLRLLTGISAVLASAFENASLFAKVQAEAIRRASLERYFSPDLVERVLKGELPLAREGHVAEGTILFIDVRGFTHLTLVTEPNVLVATLNAYFETIQRIIFRTRGTVERFGGDSILAYWGIVDHDPYSSARAIRAALAMQVELFRLNPELIAEGRPPLQAGIGLNTGEVIAGDVGSAERHEFTILGDAVNMASRFEGLARSNEIVAGRATIDDLGGQVLHVPLPPTTVKGKQADVHVSAVFGLHFEAPGSEQAGVRRYQMALHGQLDLGDGPENSICPGLEFHADGKIILEAVTPYDPEPGSPASFSWSLPRNAATLTGSGRVLEDALLETRMLSPTLSVATGSELHRIRIGVSDPQAFLALLRRAIPHAGAASPPPTT